MFRLIVWIIANVVGMSNFFLEVTEAIILPDLFFSIGLTLTAT